MEYNEYTTKKASPLIGHFEACELPYITLLA